jgi:hypothetical protein
VGLAQDWTVVIVHKYDNGVQRTQGQVWLITAAQPGWAMSERGHQGARSTWIGDERPSAIKS